MVCAQLMHKKNTSKDCDKRDNNNNNNDKTNIKKSNELRKFTPKKTGIKKPKTFTERAHFFQNNFVKEIKMYFKKRCLQQCRWYTQQVK